MYNTDKIWAARYTKSSRRILTEIYFPKKWSRGFLLVRLSLNERICERKGCHVHWDKQEKDAWPSGSSEWERIPLPGSVLGPVASHFPSSGQTAVSRGRFAKWCKRLGRWPRAFSSHPCRGMGGDEEVEPGPGIGRKTWTKDKVAKDLLGKWVRVLSLCLYAFLNCVFTCSSSWSPYHTKLQLASQVAALPTAALSVPAVGGSLVRSQAQKEYFPPTLCGRLKTDKLQRRETCG